MERIRARFENFPSQKKVAMLLLKKGIRVTGGNAYCGDIELTDAALARASGVDRRVVRTTLERISGTKDLDAVYSRLDCMLLMSDVAPEIGCSTVEIVPTDATMPGILAEVTDVIFKHGLSVRQAVVDDPGMRMDSHLIVVVDGTIPADVLPALRSCKGVSSLTIR